jgi:AcrR family transcriptional regulator
MPLPKKPRSAPPTPVDQSEYKDRLLDAAAEIIAVRGLEGLTAGKLAAHVGLKRTVVHYHFGTMDHLLAELVRRSFAEMRENIRKRFSISTIGEDIWELYSISMATAEAFRARALASRVVGEAYREVGEDLNAMLSEMLREAYVRRRSEPEVPTEVMAQVILMSAQFVGSQRSLGAPGIDAVERYMKSLFAVTSDGTDDPKT